MRRQQLGIAHSATIFLPPIIIVASHHKCAQILAGVVAVVVGELSRPNIAATGWFKCNEEDR